jgi:hypothetical protein
MYYVYVCSRDSHSRDESRSEFTLTHTHTHTRTHAHTHLINHVPCLRMFAWWYAHVLNHVLNHEQSSRTIVDRVQPLLLHELLHQRSEGPDRLASHHEQLLCRKPSTLQR